MKLGVDVNEYMDTTTWIPFFIEGVSKACQISIGCTLSTLALMMGETTLWLSQRTYL